ncbi:MAG TPA: flagellar hook-length control protein FliK [Allosphingosinicella sp.]|nr:flagellar hook-length control protein FliK [Allosphingosinicella sp.]
MASVPNMRPGSAPIIPGLTAPAVVPGGEFASLISAVPDALLQPVPTEAGEPCADTAEAEADTPAVETPEPVATSDAAQLAALLPVTLLAVTPPPTIHADASVPPQDGSPLAKTPAAPVAKVPARPATAPIPGKPEAAQPASPSPTTGQAPEPNVATPPATPETDDAQGDAPVTAEKIVKAAKRVIELALRPAAPPAAHASGASVRLQNGRIARDAEPVIDGPPSLPAVAPAAITPVTTPAAPAPLAAPAAIPAPQGAEAPDRTIDRALDLAHDGEWLDRLARDIARTAEGDAPMRFRLHPQTLGHMRVELSQGDHGTSVRLTVETEAARTILADAQPRLAAEARAQGVRIAETHVDLSGSDRHAAGDQRQQDEARQTPIIRTARGAAPSGAAPVQPARSRSDRYA